jgi:D-alanyl-D-alanine carboxypeptidase
MLRSVVAAIFMLIASASTAWSANPIVVFDGKTGEVIVSQNAGTPWYPASLTKIMTAYVVLDAIRQGKITPDTKGTVTKTSSAPPPSKIGFKRGKKVSVDFALRALLVYSANDMAALLAEIVAGDQANFARLMNATARELGMTGTHFVNPHGLYDKGQVTTARDMAILSYALISRFPRAKKYYSAPFVKVGKKKLRNRNYLLKIWDKADGIKTGFICPSGFNLVASANVNGRTIVGVVFGTRSGKARARKAKVVMENAAFYKGSSSIKALRNEGGTPRNMRKTVCGGTGLKMVNADDFSGWGVTFGKFKSAAEAEAVINGVQAVKAQYLKEAGGGVVRIPFTKDYVPVSYRMSQNASQLVCQQVRSAGGMCDVVSPSVFASFANLAGREKAKGAKPSSASAAGAVPVKMKRRKEREPAASR